MSFESVLPILVGPTGVGKTAVAIELCELINGEIVSADSLQVFRHLDIGTAKATLAEQARVRHHLLDILEPDEAYSAARWAQDARVVIEDIRMRGRVPVVVGGTGFYISALLFPQRLASAPPNPRLRKELEEMAACQGNAALHEQLQLLDAEAAVRLHVNDVPRVMRAIEVAQHRLENVTCTLPIDDGEPALRYVAFGLSLPRAQLVQRLDARIDQMQAAGFMQELRTLLERGYGQAASLQSLGYKQMRPALNDETLCEECLSLWKRDTRRYAKRQMTWFRHQLEVNWIEMTGSSPVQAAREIACRCDLLES